MSGSPSPPIVVRPVATPAEYRACQEIQRRAWGISEDGYVVPVATMISVQHAGGLVLGAFSGEDGPLVGFAFGYLGRVRGRWALYSQLAGVDPAVQDRGVGGLLKAAQRAWAREQGLELVAWSFDPLQAGNANFNLHRLGATCRDYQPDYFGDRTDALNAGLETDRLLAEWPVEDTDRRWSGDGESPVDLVVHDAGRPCAVLPANLSSCTAPLRVEIPRQVVALKESEPDTARAWQIAVRTAFTASFAAGYVAMDFTAGEHPTYLLRRSDD